MSFALEVSLFANVDRMFPASPPRNLEPANFFGIDVSVEVASKTDGQGNVVPFVNGT